MQVAWRKAGAFQPALQDPSARSAEWASIGDRAMAGCLSDYQNAIADTSADQGLGVGNIAVVLAESAGEETLLKCRQFSKALLIVLFVCLRDRLHDWCPDWVLRIH